MSRWDPLTLTRSVSAITVPFGEVVELSEGGEVQVMQRMGDSITVRTEMGALMRIEGNDADALGIEVDQSAHRATNAEQATFSIDLVTAALDRVYDPEIPVSIVQLGLVYRCDEFVLEDGRRRIEIDMTMTAPGCGMGDVLRADAMRAVSAVPGVDEVEVELVWQPQWTVHYMTEEARLSLGLL